MWTERSKLYFSSHKPEDCGWLLFKHVIYILVSEHTCPPTGLAHNDHFQSNVSPRIAPATATINFPHICHILVGANSSELLRAVPLFPETKNKYDSLFPGHRSCKSKDICIELNLAPPLQVKSLGHFRVLIGAAMKRFYSKINGSLHLCCLSTRKQNKRIKYKKKLIWF